MWNGKLGWVVFCAGLVTGVIGTYLYFKNEYELVDMEKQAKEVKELAKKVVDNKKKEEVVAVIQEDGEVFSAEELFANEVYEVEPVKKQSRTEDKWHYDLEGDPTQAFMTVEERGTSIDPITTEEFLSTHHDYHKLTIAYYQGDDVLADENDDDMDEEREAIGAALEHFGKLSDDDDVVYMRNNKLGIDYEIVRFKECYSEVVKGIYPDEI